MKHQQPATGGTHQSPAKKPGRSANKRNGSGRSEAAASGDGREQIVRQTAYSYYEARGRVDGHELEDWLKAEAQIADSSSAAIQDPASPSH